MSSDLIPLASSLPSEVSSNSDDEIIRSILDEIDRVKYSRKWVVVAFNSKEYYKSCFSKPQSNLNGHQTSYRMTTFDTDRFNEIVKFFRAKGYDAKASVHGHDVRSEGGGYYIDDHISMYISWYNPDENKPTFICPKC